MFEMHFTGVITIIALLLLPEGKFQVSLNRTAPSGILSVCPNELAVFTCQVIGSISLTWSSTEYLGQLTLDFSNSDVKGSNRTINGVVAILTQTSSNILESQLHISTSVNSSIRCFPDDVRNGESINLVVYNDFPGRPRDVAAVEISSVIDDSCTILVDWDPPTDTRPEDIRHYIVRDSINGIFKETKANSTLATFRLHPCTDNLRFNIATIDRCGREGPSSANVEPILFSRNTVTTPSGTLNSATTNTPRGTSTTSSTAIVAISLAPVGVVISVIIVSIILLWRFCRSKHKIRNIRPSVKGDNSDELPLLIDLRATTTDDDMQRAWIPPDTVWPWKGCKTISVKFLNVGVLTDSMWTIGDGQPMKIETILHYANIWSDMGGETIPRFVVAKHGEQAQIRVSFNNNQICNSQRGKKAQNILAPQPTMNLDLHSGCPSDEMKQYLIIHTFGHALGLSYEHQRSNFWKCIEPFTDTEKMKKDLDVTKKQFAIDWKVIDSSERGHHIEEYDPDSIMHHWFEVDWLIHGYSDKKKVEKNRDRGILSDKVANTLLGVHRRCDVPVNKPSPLDIELLNKLYGDEAAGVPNLKPGAPRKRRVETDSGSGSSSTDTKTENTSVNIPAKGQKVDAAKEQSEPTTEQGCGVEVTNAHLSQMEYTENCENKVVSIYEESKNRWRKIGENLGLKDYVLDAIEKDSQTVRGRVIRVFGRWQESASALPHSDQYPNTWRGLINLLNKSGLAELAIIVHRALLQQNQGTHDQ